MSSLERIPKHWWRFRMPAGLIASSMAVAAAAFATALMAASVPTETNAVATAKPIYAPVVADKPLVFPGDYGSHPQFRTEWWYVTGWLETADGDSLGFQVTFFRSKPDIDAANPSDFAPHQLLIAHGAISDPKRGRLWQDQRIRRAGLGLAEAELGNTRVWIDGWSLEQNAGSYVTAVAGEDFAFDLVLSTTQPLLLNGNSGVSRKGSSVQAASYYYSLPHLRASGTIRRSGHADKVTGEAWLDHEWSSEYLDDQAVGWDWIGINMDDGGALMAFSIRGARGEQRWAGGTLRDRNGNVKILRPGDVAFHAERSWLSPRTGIRYPVQWSVNAGSAQIELQPLLDDQENDTRLSTGAIYWEGAVKATAQGHSVGRGYLELTGYGDRLRLR